MSRHDLRTSKLRAGLWGVAALMLSAPAAAQGTLPSALPGAVTLPGAHPAGRPAQPVPPSPFDASAETSRGPAVLPGKPSATPPEGSVPPAGSAPRDPGAGQGVGSPPAVSGPPAPAMNAQGDAPGLAPPPPAGLPAHVRERLEEIEVQALLIGEEKRLATLKRELCQTQFGPVELCGAASDPPLQGGQSTGGGVPAAGAGARTPALPSVLRIEGSDGAWRATLQYPDGRQLVAESPAKGATVELAPGVHLVSIDPARRAVGVTVEGDARSLPWLTVGNTAGHPALAGGLR